VIGNILNINKSKRNNEEQKEQEALCKWLTLKNIQFIHFKNGGSLNSRIIDGKRISLEGAKFKRMGVKSGIPDLFIPKPTLQYHGLFIEMKRKNGGKLTPEQQWWLEFLNRQNYLAVSCNGWEKAQYIIETYFRKTFYHGSFE
jgi:VRR-NUC domain